MDRFVELKPGYMIPITAIQIIQWKNNKLRIVYDKLGTMTTVEIEDIRGSAGYLYDELRKLAITFEMGPEFLSDE